MVTRIPSDTLHKIIREAVETAINAMGPDISQYNLFEMFNEKIRDAEAEVANEIEAQKNKMRELRRLGSVLQRLDEAIMERFPKTTLQPSKYPDRVEYIFPEPAEYDEESDTYGNYGSPLEFIDELKDGLELNNGLKDVVSIDTIEDYDRNTGSSTLRGISVDVDIDNVQGWI